MLKADLRKLFLKKRLALQADKLTLLNIGILKQFQQLDFTRIKSIHIFLPILEKNEPDTFLMLDWLQVHHPEIIILVSRSNFEDYSMSLHPYLGRHDLKNNRYHIPEPQTNLIYEGGIDLVLIPLLAFDKNGNRIGYGKGFYDRFLIQHQAIKIGISLFNEPVEIADCHPNDIRLDYCITPKQIISFA